MFELANSYLLLLIPLPLLVRWLLPTAKQQDCALWVPFFKEITKHQTHSLQKLSGFAWKKTLLTLVWILLVVAASGPQQLSKPLGVMRSGRDIMLAIDISRSMIYNDMEWQGRQVTRLDSVKQVAGKFIDARKGDRIGLILFGTKAYLQSPLSYDRKTIKELLNDASIGLAGDRTAVGDAIGLGIKHLVHTPKKHRILILLTDGVSNAGMKPEAATALAKQENVRIYTIGFGHDQIQINGFLGPNIVNLPMDEAGLQTIAKKTNGLYFRAKDTKALATVYKKLNKVEPIENEKATFRIITPLYHYPLALAFALMVLISLLHVSRSWKREGIKHG